MSYLNVKVSDTTVRIFDGVSAKGKPFQMRSQNVIVELDDEVRKIDISLQKDQQAFSVGRYTLDPASLLAFGKYGFEIKKFSEVVLVPVAANEKPALFAKTA